eukprot:CAMPEP_0202494382 /NCGR_PEP_ID=MMETSP1361-20130828/11314_1 /ASSEMBLY_ACC=CAM_ASM_000849 /TAXON_ID=210615 /ORGANISM="Staurosira complex sp., Strain CCMP2646" /LENGTH=189 /DNA_ID=CAMNT_0049124849 /DNA_START=49 /DNA_END=618 /DNA_ORIENTATION=-
MRGQPSLSLDELSNVEEEEIHERKSTTSDESSSLLGMWNAFFHQSFSSLATTKPVAYVEEKKKTRSMSVSSLRKSKRSDRVRSLSDIGTSEFMTSRHQAPLSSDSMTIANSSIISNESLPTAAPQSLTYEKGFAEEEPSEYRHVATALRSHLLQEDIGRQVIIVCSGKKWQNTLENGWDDEDFDDEPWF